MALVRFLVADERDNVATAMTPIAKGELVAAGTGSGREAVTVNDDIPLGHKFALRPIAAGGRVIKYGETIGVASASIAPGDHVHIHNVEGLRGRGDRS